MENNTVFQIVKISGKNVVTVLFADCPNRDTADVWVDGYISGGGVSKRGKSEVTPRVEVWEVRR